MAVRASGLGLYEHVLQCCAAYHAHPAALSRRSTRVCPYVTEVPPRRHALHLVTELKYSTVRVNYSLYSAGSGAIEGIPKPQ